MLKIKIEIAEGSLDEAKKILDSIPGGYARVIKRATSRAVDKAFTEYKRAINQLTTLKPGTIGRAMTKKKFKENAYLSADPARAPLTMFGAKQIKLNKTTRRKIRRGIASRLGGNMGVRYRIAGVTKIIEGAFIARMVGKKGGGGGDLHTTAAQRRSEWESEGLTPAEIRKKSHRGVYKRIGAARLPISEKFGPSVWWIAVDSPSIKTRLPNELSIDFGKIINDQVGVELRRWQNR